MNTQRLGRLLRGSAVWLSRAVFVSILLITAIQLYRPNAVGFIHRHHTVETRTLRTIHLTAHEGGVWFDWAYHPISSDEWHRKWAELMRDHPHWWQRFDAPGGYTADEMPLGFYFYFGSNASRTRFCILRLPYWFVATASAVLPALALGRRLRTRRRRRRGLCLHCGYDLRRSAQRCPECGVGARCEEAAPGKRGG